MVCPTRVRLPTGLVVPILITCVEARALKDVESPFALFALLVAAVVNSATPVAIDGVVEITSWDVII